MSHVILGHCCKDASCVAACPRDCIRPIPGDPLFESVEHLYIDPNTCIDCSACVSACPAGAIKPESALSESERQYAERTREYFTANVPMRPGHRTGLALPRAFPRTATPLRIAIVGAGAAAMYTVRELLQRSSTVRITVFEQRAEVGGLLHTAVSRQHDGIRKMVRLFDLPFGDDRVTIRSKVRVGVDVSIAALRRQFDAVVLAVGASQPRDLGAGPIPEVHQALPLLAAVDNARPGTPLRPLRGPTTVVVGGGNVALDVVAAIVEGRMRTHSGGPVTEVTVVARSSVRRPSFTLSALYELAELDATVTVDRGSAPTGDSPDPVQRLLAELAERRAGSTRKRRPLSIALSFGHEVTSVRSIGHRIQVVTGTGRTFTTDSVVCATGFTVTPLAGVPLGESGAIANQQGRVVAPDTGAPIEGLYVVGWAKRGARGGVGDSRRCAAETVDRLVADLAQASGSCRC
ncbi:FAD-dependent oxidoreductase [Nocardia amikacinitolerans]|uniref:FAD-dependent oxidoreductase n=1 Tax=Nocardia amikacinitolerans TaxID=756689 RepID=UPI0036803E25